MSDESGGKKGLSNVVIAGVPLLGYLSAYRYEVGYVDYFGIPRTFIEVSLELTLANTAAIVMGVLSFLYILNAVVQFFHGGLDHEHRIVRRLSETAIGLIVFGYFLQGAYGFSTIFFLTFGLVALFPLILFGPALLKMGKAPWYERVQEAVNREAPDLYYRLRATIGEGPYVASVLLVFGVFLMAYLAGVGAARDQSQFVVRQDTEEVLLRRYGELFVFKAIDIESQRIENPLTVLTSSEMGTVRLTEIRLRDLSVDVGRDSESDEESDAESDREPDESDSAVQVRGEIVDGQGQELGSDEEED